MLQKRGIIGAQIRVRYQYYSELIINIEEIISTQQGMVAIKLFGTTLDGIFNLLMYSLTTVANSSCHFHLKKVTTAI